MGLGECSIGGKKGNADRGACEVMVYGLGAGGGGRKGWGLDEH